MQPREVKTIEDAKKIVEERNLTHVKIGLFDNDGVMRGKYMRREKFFSSLEKGFAFCDVVLGWDVQDQLYDNVTYTGWHTGYADQAESVCPRATLRRVIDRAVGMGFDSFAALEYEFFLFDETPDSVREKNFKNLQPMTPGWFGYSMLRNSTHAELYHEMIELSEKMDFPLEGVHTETGPGVIETAIAVDEALSAGDKAALFKTFIKILAQRHGLMATFMAKWSDDYPGQSGHIHLSLRHRDSSKSAFYDDSKKHCMSDIQRHFVAGQQKLMPHLLCMIAPTINSYSRLIPGFWAPTEATWGVENRTTALRVIPGSDKSQRVEHRLGAADAHPYLALAAALGAGLYGIEKQWEPEAQVKGNAYEQNHPDKLALPKTLWDAALLFKKSKAARALFGDAFVDHFSASREWEEREFRKHITDWEMERYFEII